MGNQDNLEDIMKVVESREKSTISNFKMGYILLSMPTAGIIGMGVGAAYAGDMRGGLILASLGSLAGAYALNQIRKCIKRERENYKKIREIRDRLD